MIRLYNYIAWRNLSKQKVRIVTFQISSTWINGVLLLTPTVNECYIDATGMEK